MVGHGGSSAGSYLADPTSPILSHCASIVMTSTLRVNLGRVGMGGQGHSRHQMVCCARLDMDFFSCFVSSPTRLMPISTKSVCFIQTIDIFVFVNIYISSTHSQTIATIFLMLLHISYMWILWGENDYISLQWIQFQTKFSQPLAELTIKDKTIEYPN